MTSKTTDDQAAAPTRAQRSRGADTRDAIIGAAIARIARLGFEGLRVRGVAQDVGINNATLHHHYPTKDDLVAGVVERFVAEFEASQPAQLADEPEQRFERYMASLHDLMAARPDIFIVMNELLLRASRDPAVASLIAPSQERWLDYLLHLLGNKPKGEAERRQVAERYRYQLLGESLAWGATRYLG